MPKKGPRRPYQPATPREAPLDPGAPYGYCADGKPRKRPAAPGTGRPRHYQVDMGEVVRMAKICCTDSEIAAVIGMSHTRFIQILREQPELAERIKRGREEGRESLRRRQWKAALQKENPTMMIWLGKNELGQTDKAEVKTQAEIKLYDRATPIEEV